MALSDLSQGCSNKSDTVMINKNVTRLTTQGCNNIVISWLYRTCWNNLATSLIISTRLLQIVNSLFLDAKYPLISCPLICEEREFSTYVSSLYRSIAIKMFTVRSLLHEVRQRKCLCSGKCWQRKELLALWVQFWRSWSNIKKYEIHKNLTTSQQDVFATGL
jgi:hypothetical protein